MRDLISEVDAHVARPPSLAECLAALRESTTATLRLIDAITVVDPITEGPGWDGPGRDTGSQVAATIEAMTDDDEPVVDREDRWIGTGEPVVEAPPVIVEGAMPADHCTNHRDHRADCRGCIVALEAQDTWRSVTANRIAAARAEAAREIAEGAKPLPPGRQAFRAAKAEFDAKRDRASDDQKSAITVILGKRGITDRTAVLRAITAVLQRPVSSRNDLSRADATKVLDRLNAIPLPPDPALPGVDHQRAVDPVDGPAAPSTEHPVVDPSPRVCGMCGHDHDGECVVAVAVTEDGEEAVMPCGCPSFEEPDYGDPDDVGVVDMAAGGIAPDEAPRSDVQTEHVDTSPAAVRSDDGPAADAADGPDDDMPAIDRVLAGIDDGDEFDRTRPGWRNYDTDEPVWARTPVTTTGGTDEPIF